VIVGPAGVAVGAGGVGVGVGVGCGVGVGLTFGVGVGDTDGSGVSVTVAVAVAVMVAVAVTDSGRPLPRVGGLTKAEIRELSRAIGLATWDKPQQPCLSSRIPYGTEVTAERLIQLARSEMALRALGLREFRVRFHGQIARIEVGEAELAQLVRVRSDAVRALQEAGFQYVALDLEPFRSGRLNEAAGLVKLRAP